MQTVIVNRGGIEERGRLPFPATTAVISITDFDYPFAQLKNEPEHRLKLAFDDVDGDIFLDGLGMGSTQEEREALKQKYHMFSDEQAHQIATFYWGLIAHGVDMLIVQCEHGQSRSAAVAAAIREFEDKAGISIFADDRFWPNKVVFRKTLKALRDYIAIDCVSVEQHAVRLHTASCRFCCASGAIAKPVCSCYNIVVISS